MPYFLRAVHKALRAWERVGRGKAYVASGSVVAAEGGGYGDTCELLAGVARYELFLNEMSRSHEGLTLDLLSQCSCALRISSAHAV
jgi:hypothetical protein